MFFFFPVEKFSVPVKKPEKTWKSAREIFHKIFPWNSIDAREKTENYAREKVQIIIFLQYVEKTCFFQGFSDSLVLV